MKKFKTQKECFQYVCEGNTIFLKDKIEETPIKFIDGVLKAYVGGYWVFCPTAFENPGLYHG